MLDNFFTAADVAQFRIWMEWAENYVILVHSSPDGDAVGSALALSLYLKSKGKTVTVAMPDMPPSFLMWVPGASDIITYDQKPDRISDLIYKADVLCCLDFNVTGRIGDMSSPVLFSRARKIMIDHHPEPGVFCDVILSRPEASSTSELIFHLICALGDWGSVTRQMAECICVGMITDTGGFAYNTNSPRFYFIISQLIEKNVDKDAIQRKIFNNYSEQRLRLTGYVLNQKMHIVDGCKTSYITLSDEEQKKFDCQKGDTEGIVNMPLQISGMLFSAFMRDDLARGVVRVSLRSVGSVPCNLFAAEYFNGGGHKNASGGDFQGSLEDCVQTFLEGLRQWRNSKDRNIRQLFE